MLVYCLGRAGVTGGTRTRLVSQGCPFLLQCIKVKSESEVDQLCLTLRPLSIGFSRQEYQSELSIALLEWVAIPFS